MAQCRYQQQGRPGCAPHPAAQERHADRRRAAGLGGHGGKPSLAWRAEHLTADARKTASHLAADVRKTTGKKFHKADKAVRKAVDHAVGA